MTPIELNNLFAKPIEVTVEAEWREVTYQQAIEGEVDQIIRPEYRGKVVGVVNMHVIRTPYLIVLSEDGRFNIVETGKVTAIDYDSVGAE